MSKERIPCPDCSTGVVGGHMNRHRGSKTCARLQKRNQTTVEMLPAPKKPSIWARLKTHVRYLRMRWFGDSL